MINLSSLTSNQLKRAAAIKDQIEALHKELASLTGAAVTTSAPAAAKSGRKKISAAGIARIKAAQKARWAKVKAAKPAVKVAVKTGAKKSKMSAAARAKIAAAAKARWAAVKAAGKKKL